MTRTRAFALFVPYLVFLLYMTLVFHTGQGLRDEDRLNLVPFRTVAYFWKQGGSSLIFNNLGNLTVFAPLGFLLPWLRGRDTPTSIGQAAWAGGGLSLAIETLQYVFGRRVADVDDVLLNLLGTVLGYLVCRAAILGVSGWRGREAPGFAGSGTSRPGPPV